MMGGFGLLGGGGRLAACPDRAGFEHRGAHQISSQLRRVWPNAIASSPTRWGCGGSGS